MTEFNVLPEKFVTIYDDDEADNHPSEHIRPAYYIIGLIDMEDKHLCFISSKRNPVMFTLDTFRNADIFRNLNEAILVQDQFYNVVHSGDGLVLDKKIHPKIIEQCDTPDGIRLQIYEVIPTVRRVSSAEMTEANDHRLYKTIKDKMKEAGITDAQLMKFVRSEARKMKEAFGPETFDEPEAEPAAEQEKEIKSPFKPLTEVYATKGIDLVQRRERTMQTVRSRHAEVKKMLDQFFHVLNEHTDQSYQMQTPGKRCIVLDKQVVELFEGALDWYDFINTCAQTVFKLKVEDVDGIFPHAEISTYSMWTVLDWFMVHSQRKL